MLVQSASLVLGILLPRMFLLKYFLIFYVNNLAVLFHAFWQYRLEYFAINVGRKQFTGGGSSIKKTTTNVQKQGTVYKVYGCGILMPKGSALDAVDNPDILIPLETLVILST